MIENHNWSVNCGRWLNTPVRFHAIFILLVILIFGIASQHPRGGPVIGGTAFVTTLVLLFSVILHELAHAFTNTNLGGHVNGIVLTPWGGNSDYLLPESNQARLIVYLSGAFANLIVFGFGATLLIQTQHLSLFQLVNPLDPHNFDMTKWEPSLLSIITWVNFQLFILNLIPCFPFDGAQVLRVVIDMLNPTISRLHAEASIKVFGTAVAITLVGAAWFLQNYQVGPLQPAWCVLLVFAVLMGFCAQYSYQIETSNLDDPWDELNELDQVGLFDETNFFDHDPENTVNYAQYSQWLAEKQELRRQEELELEMEEMERSDIILEKLHRCGIESLTSEEKSLLGRVSQRLRQQREQQI